MRITTKVSIFAPLKTDESPDLKYGHSQQKSQQGIESHGKSADQGDVGSPVKTRPLAEGLQGCSQAPGDGIFKCGLSFLVVHLQKLTFQSRRRSS